MPNPSPLWRRLEAALIELLREEGFELEQSKGDTYVTTYDHNGQGWEICLGDFAKLLEERI